MLSYVPALTGLRGLAVLCVLVFHIQVHWLPGGFLGVDIFFVLSGFLITSLLSAEYRHHQIIDWRKFYWRRAQRLLPALGLMLGVFMLALTLRDGVAGLYQSAKEVAVVLAYASNWTRAFDWHAPYYLGHSWSLSIEEQFYLLWPWCVLGLMRLSTSKLLPLLLCAAFSSALWRGFLAYQGAPVDRLYNGLDTRLDGLLLGALLGIAYSRGLLDRLYAKLPQRLWLYVGSGALGVLAYGLFASRLWLDMRLYFGLLHLYQWAVAALLLAVLAPHEHGLKRFFAKPVWLWLGTRSYAAYLWHFPLYRLLQEAGFNALSVLLVGLPLSLLIAHLSWCWLEAPLLNKAKAARLQPVAV